MKRERLDKILSHHGFGSRKDVKKLLHSGRVNVNGKICTLPDVSIDLDIDVISIDDEVLKVRKHVYLMMNKCEDGVCSNKDGIHSTVFDLVPEEYKTSSMGGELHCVGRLDIDTEGLLLLTDDGDLAYKLTHPKHEIYKKYLVKITSDCGEPAISPEVALSKPIEIDGIKLLPAKCSLVEQIDKDKFILTISIREGKNRQIRRMCVACGYTVNSLKRVAVGKILLGDLPTGSWRSLTESEIKYLKSL